MSRRDKQIRCTSAQESIESYLDDVLSPDETAILEGHFEICARCQHELSIARRVLDGLHGLAPLDCPDHVTNEVFERIHANITEKPPVRRGVVEGFLERLRTKSRLLQPALASALIVLVVLSVFVVGKLNKPTEEITAAQIEEAEAVVKWTFAYVSDVGRRSGLAVRDEVFEAGVIQPMQRAVRSAIDGEARTPENKNGGSI
jgi:anti-sigma factor RsiW